MKAAFRGLFLLVIFLGILTSAGCGGGASGTRRSTSPTSGGPRTPPIAQLTKVLLEEQLGYEEVTVHTSDLDSVYEDVAEGDLDAFQDVWLPNQQQLLDSVQDDVEQLAPSYEGETEQGIAVPYYMDATSLDQLDQSEAELILGIEPGSVVMGVIYDEVIPAYDLPQKLVEGPTQGMLAEVDNATEMARSSPWSPGRRTG
jgi:glycine betaine/proline transport system substrate-binding protein